MRLAPCFLLPAAVSAAKASLGNLYIHDNQVSGHDSTASVKADAARLIIASRLGLDQYHSIHGQDEASLESINRLSGQSSFFSSQDAASVALILSAVGQDDLPFSSDSAHVQKIQIQNAPSFDVSEKLVNDLAYQSGVETRYDLSKMYLSTVSSYDGPSFRIVENAQDLAAAYDSLVRQHDTVLMLNVPNDTTTKNTYGHYEKTIYGQSTTHSKRQFKEAPLITESTKTLSPFKATLTPDASSNKTYNNTTPLKGILPQCFNSLAACQSLTRNCTGHGSCVLARTDRDADKPAGKCYSCSCKADVRTNADGTTKTTRWGGPACQKKDVVVPFWLLSTFAVFMAFVISWGVGLLYTMGSQELPSVIGAGVSGVPRAK